jgi:hypothetical protein
MRRFLFPLRLVNVSRLKALTPGVLLLNLALLIALSPIVASQAGTGFGLASLITGWYLFLRPSLNR